MNTLVYKRTHSGDPDERGIFGHRNCMGRVRCWNFDAVVGVGGKRPWPGNQDIANKITWVGTGARKIWVRNSSGKVPLVEFDRFVLFESKGPELKQLAPKLFKYMYEDQHVRVVLSRSLPSGLQKEITIIIEWAKKQKMKRQYHPDKILTEGKCCVGRAAKPGC